MKKVQLHCDGASLSNPGKAGGAAILLYNGRKKEFAFAFGIESNNRAELLAIIHGLNLLTEACEVEIFSDSQITIKCITGEFSRSSNIDLWHEYEKAASFHKITATWNRRDSTEWNKRCNELANKAAKTQKAWQNE